MENSSSQPPSTSSFSFAKEMESGTNLFTVAASGDSSGKASSFSFLSQLSKQTDASDVPTFQNTTFIPIGNFFGQAASASSATTSMETLMASQKVGQTASESIPVQPVVPTFSAPSPSFSFSATLEKVSKAQAPSAEVEQTFKENPEVHTSRSSGHMKDNHSVMHGRSEEKGSSESTKSSTDSQKLKSSQEHSSMVPVTEISLLKSIICKGVHSNINNKETLLKHFSQFGEVQKVTINKKQNHAIIIFRDHETAEQAKKKGCIISPMHNPVSIFWLQSSTPSKKVKERKASRIGDVDDELKAMLEVDTEHDLLSRPDENVLKGKKSLKDQKRTPVKELKKASTSSSSSSKDSPRKSKEDSSKKSRLKSLKESKSLPIKKERQKREKKVVQEKPPGDAKSDGHASQEENLIKVLMQEAHTAEERFSVLDARDKLIRLGQKKQLNLATAAAMVGTCPDMCPEKERYGRFAKCSLSVFELREPDVVPSSSSINRLEHQLVIKEYSRSSADQEEPLPHELRPTAALQKTMDYLLCNIMDKLDAGRYSVRDWYDFIWSRTRAIRKDITQQHLCNLECVAIVEKCARFHIHCAAALCEEDMAVFDQKINNENLTKCLQTLKHFYEDLWNKGVSCPNEPEFRAYDILLSLNEGDALRHVQKLREDVRVSNEVQFAVCAALCYSSNNYVKFFRLVRETTYMNACILHRYFTHVRVQAMHITLKAYCAPNRVEMYPINDLLNMLLFENLSKVVEFCEMLGFKVDEHNVHLDRSAFALPVMPFACTRSPITVESKRRCSLGEAINNEPLPTNPLDSYCPDNSFDERGQLKKSIIEALVPNKKKIVVKDAPIIAKPFASSSAKPVVSLFKVPEFVISPEKLVAVSTMDAEIKTVQIPSSFAASSQPVIPSTTAPPVKLGRAQFSSEAPHAGEDKFDIIHSKREDNSLKFRVIRELVSNIVFDVVSDMARSVASKELFVEKDLLAQAKQAILKQTLALQQKKKAADTDKAMQEIFSEMVQNEVRFSAEECMKASRREIKEQIFAEIISNCIDDIICVVAAETFEIARNKWMSLLNKAKEEVDMVRAREIFDIWKTAADRKKKNQEGSLDLLLNFPLIGAQYSPSNSSALKNPVYAMKMRKHVSHLLSMGVMYETIKEELAWMPLDLSSVFEKAVLSGMCFPQISPKTSYWKMLLLVPEDGPKPELITKWISRKFTKGFVKKDGYLGTSLCSLYWLTDPMGNSIAVCIRKITLCKNFPNVAKNLEDGHLLEGTCGILLCLPYTDQNLVHESCSQLKQLLKIKAPIPKLPVYCLQRQMDCSSNSNIVDSALEDLKRDDLLSDYNLSIFESCDDLHALSQMVHSSTEWLISNFQQMPAISTIYLKDFVENCINEIFNVIFEDLAHRKGLKTLYQDPMCIITFFNDIKEKKALAVRRSVEQLSWPLPELDEYSESSAAFSHKKRKKLLKSIKDVFSSLTLPSFRGNPASVDDAWDYVLSVKSTFKAPDEFYLLSSVKYYIDKTLKLSSVTAFWIPWVDILHECACHIASTCSYVELDSDEELQICGVPELLTEFNLVSMWQRTRQERSTDEDVLGNEINYSTLTGYSSPATRVSPAPLKRKMDMLPDSEPFPEPASKVIHLDGASDLFSLFKAQLESEKEELAALNDSLEKEQEIDESLLISYFGSKPSFEHPADDDTNVSASAECELMDSDGIFEQITNLKNSLKFESMAQEFFESRLSGIAESYSDCVDQLC